MYGLILLNIQEYIINCYGKNKWEEIKWRCNIKESVFLMHQIYPDSYITKIIDIATEALKVEENQFFESIGNSFVTFLGIYGYDQVLSVLGRYFRDFLNGLDNLHEYMKFSYPQLVAPSFMCENETKYGLMLHYRSKRRKFIYYTIGIIKQVAKDFYNKELLVEVKNQEEHADVLQVSLKLSFNNEEYVMSSHPLKIHEKHISICSLVFFEIFPFSIAFRLVISSSDMKVKYIGNSLMVLMPDILEKKLTDSFEITRPIIPPTFPKILTRANNIFELVSIEPVLSHRKRDNKLLLILEKPALDEFGEHNLILKGQMIFMEKWKMMVYLGTPVMPNLDYIIGMGLYINDLSLHDFSRDLMLAGTQQSVELKLALEQEQEKTKRIEESMNRLDEEMERTNRLLYQMIPENVAERLRAGESPVDTCQKFEEVSILFSDVVEFTKICAGLSPMEVVSLLNRMYSIFDSLTELHKVQKVETIGDAYMVFSTTKDEQTNHVCKVCDMALHMMCGIQDLKDPKSGSHLKLRIGIHTGPAVAGIVGLKMPRYCLFGKTVSIASQMESSSMPMKIHISQSTKNILPPEYYTVYRGKLRLTNNCVKKTYWLETKTSIVITEEVIPQIHVNENELNNIEQGEDFSLKQLNSADLFKEQAYLNFDPDNSEFGDFSDSLDDVKNINVSDIFWPTECCGILITTKKRGSSRKCIIF